VNSPLADRQRLALQLAVWLIVGGLVAALVHGFIGTSWTDALLFGLPLGLIAAPAALSAWFVCRAIPLRRTPPLLVVGIALAGAAGLATLWAGLGRLWWMALAAIGRGVSPVPPAAVLGVLGTVGVLAYLLSVAMHYMWIAFEDSNEAARRALESDVAQREAELRALRAQVDPHFLFNSLTAVVGLIGADPARARQMCQLLADFLRESLRLGGASQIALGREIALAEQYLRIEQVRFGARLEVRASIAPDAARVLVPSLLLQPLVENAVRHGVATCLEGGAIDIAISRQGDRVAIAVDNPYDPDEGRRGTGFGLDIVRRRLAAAFADRATLVVDRAPAHFRVSITLPVDGEQAVEVVS
jgi:signal transduction histidine kinase